ncbi:MAG TPA: HEAT repeat domain-containing protein [Pyrinomonadaceae bacterium]
MRRKLFAAAILLGYLPVVLPLDAAAQDAPRPRPRVEVTPRVEIAPLPPSIAVIPEINIDLGQIEATVAAAAAMAPLPPIDIDGPQVYVNDGDVWVGDEYNQAEETRQTFQLSPGARVELADVNGPVQIDTADGNAAELHVKTYASTKPARKLAVEQAGNGLTIRGESKQERERLDRWGSTRHHVRLTIPRRANLSMTNVTDSVRVGELDGTVTLTNVSGRVGVAQAAGGAELTNVSGSVVMTISNFGRAGATVRGVPGRVTLRFLGDVNADLQTDGVKGKVYVELPNVAVQGEMTRADFRAKVGAGGAPLRVSDVAGTVRLSPGRTVSEMLTALKSARSNDRSQAANDLALHVSNRQARAAFVEALGADTSGSAVQQVAARELAAYANEPEVREVFLRVMEAATRNSAVRMTAARALARQYPDDRQVREAMLRVLAADKNESLRMTVVNAVARQVEDPAVTRALTGVVRGDTRDSTRARAAAALAKRADNAEVYELLVNAARNDKSRSVRVAALSGLARRIRERPELRELFVGYLDNESISLQFHALRGLVELNDPALRQRLVEKAREIVLQNGRRYWNDRMVLDTIILVRKLDPQEADRLLEQLSAERARTVAVSY